MNDSTRYVAPSAPPSDHMPLIPGRSTRACHVGVTWEGRHAPAERRSGATRRQTGAVTGRP
eukprot:4976321-Prymnesium_polylepis.1